MANQKEPVIPELPHTLTLDNRRLLRVTGVTEVERFDEQAVVLHTARGVLLVRGENLHMQTLSIDGGQVSVDGTITALMYEEPQKPGGFLSRLFG
jgi:sporulation protein YabP